METLGADQQNHARTLVCYTFQALKNLFSATGKTRFDFGEVLSTAKTLDTSLTDNDLILALMLASDFTHLILGHSTNGEGKMTSVTISEDILDYESFDKTWTEELEQRKSLQARLEKTGQRKSSLPKFVPHELAETDNLTFDFVTDDILRDIVIRDYKELQSAKSSSAIKTRLILSGGLIEAILLDILQRNESRAHNAKKAERKKDGKEKSLDEWSLGNLIDVAVELELISSSTQSFGHSVREYRNLVHPGKEKRSNYKIQEEEADIAEKVLDIVIRDLQERKHK